MEFFNLCAFVPKKKNEIYSTDSAPLNAKGEVLGGWATTDNSGLHCKPLTFFSFLAITSMGRTDI